MILFTDLLDERVDPHDRVHPFPAQSLFVPVLLSIWRHGLVRCVCVHGNDDDGEAGSGLVDVSCGVSNDYSRDGLRGVREDGAFAVQEPVAAELDAGLDHPA
mgnify:CR=1 FL=1|jgi:hypothetical protein